MIDTTTPIGKVRYTAIGQSGVEIPVVIDGISGVYEAFSITNTLTNCTTTNSAQTVGEYSAYNATINPIGGFTFTGATEISITMGGVNITSTAFTNNGNNGAISIPSVTGDIVINIRAISETSYITFSSDDYFQLSDNLARRSGYYPYWEYLEYSDDGINWYEWTRYSDLRYPIDASAHYYPTDPEDENSELIEKYEIYLRGTGNSVISGDSDYFSPFVNPYYYFIFNGASNIRCSGNIETLLDYQTASQGYHPTMDSYCFKGLFYNCSLLSEPPVLPADILSDWCYAGMFCNCISLDAAPELPATTLAESCYSCMFYGCLNLVTMAQSDAYPLSLPARTLDISCYNQMFESCYSLTTTPALPATVLAAHCYERMFYGCGSLATIPELPATTLPEYCYEQMFQNASISFTSAEGYNYIGNDLINYTVPYRIPSSGSIVSEDLGSGVSTMLSSADGTSMTTETTYYLPDYITVIPANS